MSSLPVLNAEDSWQDWPLCPQCGQKRQVRCSVCGTAGSEFPLVDIHPSGGYQQVLLFCPTCDDHFRPQFYRRCHGCGYDYGEGIGSGGEPHGEPEGVTARTWLIVWILLAVAAGVIGYFGWLLRR